MDAFESEIHQVFLKLLDGNHRILNFDAPSVSISSLKSHIEALTSIPSGLQLLLNNSRILDDQKTLIIGQSDRKSQFSETLFCDSSTELEQDRGFTRCRSDGFGKLRGGKGGFGSLLRGAATKAGQKKTNNFDACRDMSGRRLRHVNVEKRLEEWRAEAEERKLVKMADEFLKKKAKEIKRNGKGNGGDGAEKYVAKYREDSEKCREEVERSVRELVKGLVSSKRKSPDEGNASATKKFKISHSDSVVRASSGSINGGELGAGSIEQGPSGNGSEEEDTEVSLISVKSLDGCGQDGNSKHRDTPVLLLVIENLDGSKDNDVVVSPSKSHPSELHEVVSQHPGTSVSEDEVVSDAETRDISAMESASAAVSLENTGKPLNFDDYHSPSEMEVLGLERLKSELQARGLKCGGTLKEREERLFLLKTTPLEMLPKKLFAKK
ncbi:hypothetical protein SASPL_116708 [Salvia splendens]|uniref:Ubiquitin-like domain-containing protein n=1 Tax=Salvia splendens TaxID=180675 RepID=A0A8X8XU82_SALSN|nr:hypothetical protein SASPL_116708 [Salvia splendens]